MQIHLLSSRSSASHVGAEPGAPSETGTGHPDHLPEDLSRALRENGHRVEIDLLGDALNGHELSTLREGATAGRKIAARLNQAGTVLHALDPVAWAAALTARSLTDVSVVLRFSEPGMLGEPLDNTGDLGSGRGAGGGAGRVSTIGSATERRAYRACLRSADAIAAAADDDRLAAVRVGVADERALIVPDLVTCPPEQPEPALLHQGRHLLALGGIGPGSGIESMLAALRRLPGRDLVVIGPGSSVDAISLRTAIERLALTGRVSWVGRLDRADAFRLIDRAALVILPGPAAAIGAVEAMTRARAVVTIDGGPAADAVVNGVTGSVVPAGHPELLAATLRSLLHNTFQLEAMGLAGRERALTRYAPALAVSATEQAYRIALGAA